MRKLFAPLLAAVGVLVLLTGCGSVPLTGFTVELLKIEQAADGSATVTMRLVNPNVVSYNVESSTNTVFLNGKPAGTIKVVRPEGIAPQSSITVTGTFTTIQGYTLVSGPASYRLEATLVILLYGDSKEKQKLSGAGTVEVSVK
jgi:hypothetical protein